MFNFFFTIPKYSFNAYEAQYPITFGIMLAVAIITSTLATKLQHQAQISELKEKRTEILFETTQKLILAKGEKEISEIAIEKIVKLFNKDVAIYVNQDEKIHLVNTNNKNNNLFLKDERAVANWVYANNKEAGFGTNTLPGSKGYYMPIKGRNQIFAVLGIDMSDGEKLSLNQKSLLNAVIAQIILAFEKEALYKIQQISKMEIERERLKSNLLRAISHDLRTPLTIISGSTTTLLNDGKNLTEDTKKELLQNIYNDSQWLINLVENLLSISRIDNGNIQLNRKVEVIEEIIAEALSHINNRNNDHKITLDIPEDMIEINIDGKLAEQVLINIIDNAIKYTKKGTEITLVVKKEINKVNFEISDNGEGINSKDIPHIFDMFYTADKNGDSKRGLGLGLSLCKSIINAHGGEIDVKNNNYGGATFYFWFPLNKN